MMNTETLKVALGALAKLTEDERSSLGFGKGEYTGNGSKHVAAKRGGWPKGKKRGPAKPKPPAEVQAEATVKPKRGRPRKVTAEPVEATA